MRRALSFGIPGVLGVFASRRVLLPLLPPELSVFGFVLPQNSILLTESLDKLENLLKSERLNVHYCLETHAHADHLSGAQELKNRFPQIKLAIGERITEVQSVFKKIFNLARLKRHSIGLNLPGWHWDDFIHLSLGLPPFAD